MKRILIIDDNKGDKVLIEEMFKTVSLNYDVKWAESGDAGLAMASKEPFDIILLDTLMPGMDGHETCLALKENKNVKSNVIMMTGSLDAVSEVKARKSGADGYCIKLAESILSAILSCHKE